MYFLKTQNKITKKRTFDLMEISVIIPVYNRPELVSRAINSILKQTIRPLEIIVVDDGSTDETPAVLEAYKTDILILTQENKGVAAARNSGIKQSQGDWVAFLDSDDEWLSDKLEKAIQFHRRHPDYRIFQSEEIWVRNGKKVNPRRLHQKFGGRIFKQCLPLCIVSPSAVLIEKALIEQTGYFDEQFTVCEDYDLWLRIAKYHEIGLNPVPGVIKYGGHRDQLSTMYWGMDLYRVRAMEKQLYDPELTGEFRIWVLEEILIKLKILINGYRKRHKDYSELQQKYDSYAKELEKLLG